MSVTITADNGSTVLRSVVMVTPHAGTETHLSVDAQLKLLSEQVEMAYDEAYDKFLDGYEVYAEIRDKLPFPFQLDSDGTAVADLERVEKDLRKQFQILEKDHKTHKRLVRLYQASIDLMQNIRWLVMVNDGLLEDGGSDRHKTADSFMASMGL